jgi:hypothetical protein
MLTKALGKGQPMTGGYGPVPQPQPLGRERMHEIQDDIAQAARDGQDREGAEKSRKATRRRWLRFLRRS